MFSLHAMVIPKCVQNNCISRALGIEAASPARAGIQRKARPRTYGEMHRKQYIRKRIGIRIKAVVNEVATAFPFCNLLN